MKRTSSRSAKATPKPEPEPDTSGTPPIDPISVRIWTVWRVSARGKSDSVVRVEGNGNGRFSISSKPGHRGNVSELRFYKDATTKVFDAVLLVEDLVSVNTTRATVELAPTSMAELEGEAKMRAEIAGEHFKRIIADAIAEDEPAKW